MSSVKKAASVKDARLHHVGFSSPLEALEDLSALLSGGTSPTPGDLRHWVTLCPDEVVVVLGPRFESFRQFLSSFGERRLADSQLFWPLLSDMQQHYIKELLDRR